MRLSTRNDLEPAVQTHKFTGSDTQFLRDSGPGFLQMELHPLVVAGQSVLLDQPLADDHTRDQIPARSTASISGPTSSTTRAGPTTARPPRRRHGCLGRQLLRNRPTVQPGLLRDLRQADRTALTQIAKPAKYQPPMRAHNHDQPPSAAPTDQAAHRPPAASRTSQTEHVHPYTTGHDHVYADTGRHPGHTPQYQITTPPARPLSTAAPLTTGRPAPPAGTPTTSPTGRQPPEQDSTAEHPGSQPPGTTAPSRHPTPSADHLTATPPARRLPPRRDIRATARGITSAARPGPHNDSHVEQDGHEKPQREKAQPARQEQVRRNLPEAPQRRPRMTDLAERPKITRSRLTHAPHGRAPAAVRAGHSPLQ
ncbi:hypothetical protein GCM10010335_59380 [Streptomyces galbus]|nr:hypothetical protein GCM10010335_59380 [Streptomyces galbus]